MSTAIPIDKEKLRAKYLAERDKRLRPDGNDQYLRLAGTSLAHYLDDPYMPVVEREPVNEEGERPRAGLVHDEPGVRSRNGLLRDHRGRWVRCCSRATHSTW